MFSFSAPRALPLKSNLHKAARGVALAFMLGLSAIAVQAAPAELLRPVVASSISSIAAQAMRASPVYEAELMRTRGVLPDVDLLMQTAAELTHPNGAGKAIRVGFFDNTALVVDLTAAQQVGDRLVLTGIVPGIIRSTATFVVKGDTVVGNVHALDRVYQLRFREGPGGIGVVHEAREIDPSLLRDHDRHYNDFVQQEDSAQKAIAASPAWTQTSKKQPSTAKSQALETGKDDGSIVDVLVGYTTGAKNGAGGTAAIVAQIELAIEETNLTYQNSNIMHRLRLVKTLEVDYAETGASSTDLSRLRNRTDRFADEIHIYREAYGADIVSLFVERMNDACGIGYLMTNVNTTFAASAFNVVARRCGTGSFTFAHEIGHNMGLRHDTFEDPGSTPFPDAHGYVQLEARYRTVMAYNDACTAQGFSCRRTANFSNPDILIDAFPSGLVDSANAARVLNVTRSTVANFAQAVNVNGGGTMLYFRTSYTGTEGGTVQLTVERIAGATGVASVQYSTVAGTALPGVDFVPTTGTLTWTNGDVASKIINVPLVQNGTIEPSRFFTVVLSNPSGGTLGSSNAATVAVLDDEPGVFPAGCVLPAGWSNNTEGSAMGWVAASDNASEGRCSLKSGPIGDSSGNGVKIASRISVTGNFLAGNVSFARRVSTEDTFDCFRFTIDGVQQNVGGQCSEVGGVGASGEVPWGTVSVPISAGRHTLTWSYEKDANATEGEDAVWIDDVRLPAEGVLLTVAKSGNGNGTVTSTPAGINCGSSCTYAATPNSQITLSATGSGNDTFAGWSGACSGTGNCVVALDASKQVTAAFNAAPGSKPLDYSDLWWGGEAENGWGISITQHEPSNVQFIAFYVYEADGKATWYVLPSGTWNADFTVYTGALYRPTGSPANNYVASQVVVGASVGTATVTYTSLNSATVSYTINGVSASKNIVRQAFGAPSSNTTLKVGDLWWGGTTQNGWGVSISQQLNTLFAVWYTYDANGKATWYVMPGGQWAGNNYIGTLYSTAGSPWLGTTYNPGTLAVTTAGSVTFAFTPDADGKSSSSAMMSYIINSSTVPGVGIVPGFSHEKRIVRQGF